MATSVDVMKSCTARQSHVPAVFICPWGGNSTTKPSPRTGDFYYLLIYKNDLTWLSLYFRLFTVIAG
jgi:hypothetical protein